MRSLVGIIGLAALALVPSLAAAQAPGEEADRLINDVLERLKLGGDGAEPSGGGPVEPVGPSGSGSTGGLIATLLAAAAALGEGAMATAESVLGLGLSVVASLFGALETGGETGSAAVEAVVTAPAASAAIASVIAILVGGGVTLWALLQRYGSLGAITLFTRIAKNDLLENKVRSEIFELIKGNPGINVSEIARRLDIAWGTATHHLQKLRSEKLVAIRSNANQKCYFVNGGSYTPSEMDLMSAIKHPTARAIAELLVTRGPTCHQDIGHELDLSPGLTSFHMRKLLEAGVVGKQREGRRTLFSSLALSLDPAARPAHL